ncbi:uncharacterized protein LOC112506041 [Cynara cardunculus var. scolymus]|uniref:uncharacterized protein LOC112506041 n=1 Tax=Cynara cardunculus var. scolymus TaxID=59895 RepID=UPI000D630AD6|nr:uncharacterized protein LOC112506041 [Cynara cardunculus var. scolymus]
MADGDEASHTPSNNNVGENAPHLDIYDDEAPMSPRSKRLMQRMTLLIQQTLAQQLHDDRKSEDDKSKGKEKETADTSKPKTDRVSFKTFRGSGATEFFGKVDPLEALEWILNTEKVFRITRVLSDDKVNYTTTMFKSRALIWWNATFAALEKEFLDLNQGKMSVVDYETEFNHKAQFSIRLLTTEQECVDHFIDGLRSEIRDVIANRNISEFDKAVESARRREHDLTHSDRNPAPPAKRPRIEGTISAPPQQFSMNFNLRYAQSQARSRSQSWSQAYSLQSNALPPCSICGKAHRGRCNTVRPEVRCHGCGEAGHVRPNYSRRDMTCYSCGAIGHRQRKFPRSKPEESMASVGRPSTSGAPREKEEVLRVQARAFQITAEETQDKPDVVMGIFLVNSHPARILFDSGATNSFVSHTFARCLNFVPYVLAKPFYVDTADGTSMLADKVYKDCVLQLDEHEFFVDLVPMDIYSFDIIIVMDWLTKNRADILCFQRIIRIPYDVDYLYVYGEKHKGDVKLISTLKARRNLSKDCSSYLAYIFDASKEVKKTVSDIPVVCEFPDLFPEDIPGLPPDRQVEF